MRIRAPQIGGKVAVKESPCGAGIRMFSGDFQGALLSGEDSSPPSTVG